MVADNPLVTYFFDRINDPEPTCSHPISVSVPIGSRKQCICKVGGQFGTQILLRLNHAPLEETEFNATINWVDQQINCSIT